MKIFMIVFCILFFTYSVVFAAHPLTTDDIGIVEIGKYELEVGYDNCKRESELRNHSCGISLKHGITEKMDVGISFPYQIEPKPEEPFGTTTLGFKFLLLKDIFALTVNNELGSSEYFINGIFTREVQSITIHANIGYAVSGDENTEGEIIHSSAFEYPLSKIDLVGEIIGEKIGFLNYLLGVRYKVADISSLNFAYGNGFRKTDEKIAFGFHTEF
ncbi:MAG: hypothetical protein V1833_04800 [Elusimicrobiota bacterium]